MSDSKQRILDIAARRFAQQGYEGTSLQGIADEVGMRKPSLLYHFGSKKELREAVITDLLERWQIRLPQLLAKAGTGDDRFTALFEEVSLFFESDPSRALLVMREVVDRPHETRERLGASVRPWFALLKSAIEDGKRNGNVRSDVDPEAYLVQCIVMIVGSVVGSEMGSEVFGGDSQAEWTKRQRNEARRIAKQSFFVD